MDRRAFLVGAGATTALGALSGVSGASALEGEGRSSAASVGGAARGDSEWAVDWRSRWPTSGRIPTEVQAILGGGWLYLTPRVAGLPERVTEFEGEDLLAVGLDTTDGSYKSENRIEMGVLSSRPAGAVWADGRFVMTGLTDEGERTFAVDLPEDGDRDGWVTRVDGVPSGPPAATDGTVLVPAGASVAALFATDGSVAWTAPSDSTVTGVATGDGTVYATTDGGALSAVDAESGEPQWTVSPVANGRLRGPTVAGDRVLALDEWGGVHAVGTDGSAAWSTVPDGVAVPDGSEGAGSTDPPGTLGPVAADGDRCYVTAVLGTGNRERTAVTALSLTDGTEEWTYEFPNAYHADVHSVRIGPPLQPRAVGGSIWAAGRRTAVTLDPASGALQRRWGFRNTLVATPLPTESAVYFFDEFGVYRVDRSVTDCRSYDFSSASASYEFGMDGEELSVGASVTGEDCPAIGTVDLLVDGEYRASAGGYLGADEGRVRGPAYRWTDLPESIDHATLRVRGTDGKVVATRRVGIDDYREEPPDFRLSCPSLSTVPLGIGTHVSVEIEARNFGAAPEYVATLEEDGAVLDRQRGSVERKFTDSGPGKCHGTTLRFSTQFLGFRQHDLSVSIEPRGERGSGDVEHIGSVDSGNPYALGGLATAAALSGGYVRRKIRLQDGQNAER